MTASAFTRTFLHVYATLLWLLPRRLRRDFGADMLTLARRRLAEVHDEPRRARFARVAATELTDLVRTIVREHRRSARRNRVIQRSSPNPRHRGTMTQDLVLDVRFALRSLAKRPLFTVVVLAIVSLGIGAATTVFTLYQSVILRPLPYPEAERLVYAFGANANNQFVSIAPLDFLDYRERSDSFESFAAFNGFLRDADLTGDGEPERLELRGVSHEFFETLGLPMALGRDFAPEEESLAASVIVLSHGTWQRRFDGDPAIVGKDVTLDGEAVRVIGVAPAGLLWVSAVDGWFPIPFDSAEAQVRRFHFLRGVGRLRAGVELDSARAELDAIAADLASDYPETNTGWTLNPIPLRAYVVGNAGTVLAVLMGAVAAILLIVCSNVATMMLTRSSARSAELAVRAALGASSGRVARLVLTESILLAGAGGVLGTWFGARAVALLGATSAAGLPSMTTLRMDPTVLAASLTTTVIAGVFVGLIPSLRVARRDIADLMRGARTAVAGESRARRALITTQVALSAALLIGAALLVRSLWSLQDQDAGFRSSNIVSARVALPDARYRSEEVARDAITSLVNRVSAAPGIEAAGGVSIIPFTGGNDIYTTRTDLAEDDPTNGASPQFRIIEGDYFGTLEIPLKQGRPFDARDDAGAPATAVIDEQLSRALFGDESALGKRVRVHTREPRDLEIIGVVGDVLHFGLGSTLYGGGTIYLNARQFEEWGITIVARSSNAASAVATIRSIVRDLDPLLPLSRVQTFDSLVGASLAGPRFRALLVASFAASALFLATVGLYGVMSFWVAERQREVGVRVALGAHRGSILRLVLRRGLALVATGLALGTAMALTTGRFLESMLFGVSTYDPVSLTVVIATLGATGMLACLLPAWRAARIDPIDALRTD